MDVAFFYTDVPLKKYCLLSYLMSILLGYEEAIFFQSIFRRLHIYSIQTKVIMTLLEWLQTCSTGIPISFHLSVILKYQAVIQSKLTVLRILKYINAYSMSALTSK